jgi:gamma-glutamyl:cysteine ligase YbdK (ATP-grasp superfamily)
MRALPAGPSVIDMVANAAFMIGLAEGIRPQINELLPALPFHMAEYNFYRAAQHGLEAQLVWPEVDQYGCIEQSVAGIIERKLPLAKQGLLSIGVDENECDHYLGVIERRLAANRTGASWQMDMLHQLEASGNREQALHQMLEAYISNSHDNAPVAEWSL